MNDIIFVGYYTKNTPYEEVANTYLIPSLKKFKLNYYVAAVDSLGSWYKNTAFKAKFLREMLDKYSTIVYIDSDAEIKEYPELFFRIPEEYSLGIHYLNWNIQYGYKNNPPILELYSGTVFIRSNFNTKQLCEEWYNKSINTIKWEQKVLQEILPKYNIKVYELPREYAYIRINPNGLETPNRIEKPVIEHYQVSRKYKKLI